MVASFAYLLVAVSFANIAISSPFVSSLDPINLFRRASSGCSATGSASCHNTTRETDLCCFESPGVSEKNALGQDQFMTNFFHSRDCYSKLSSGTRIRALVLRTAGQSMVLHHYNSCSSITEYFALQRSLAGQVRFADVSKTKNID